MKAADITRYRLINQKIASSTFKKPSQVVEWLVAMQSQEWPMGKWAIGLRLPGCKDAAVEEEFNKGNILRTHVLRPTWHFVSPKDIRWLLQISAPRVHALNAYYYRKLELDKKIFSRCNRVMEKVLRDHQYCTREKLQQAFAKIGISSNNLQLAYIIMYAELEGIICSGPREGKQFTYALLEERAPSVSPMSTEEALAILALRYFTSRGPATAQDFSWWSGLSVADAKKGIASLPRQFIKTELDAKTYIFAPHKKQLTAKSQTTFILPDYDEYGISYKDRSAYIHAETMSDRNAESYPHLLIVDGKAAGSWQKKAEGNKTVLVTSVFQKMSKAKQQAISKAMKQYIQFFSGD